MFEGVARELFKEAGVDPDQNPDLLEQANDILNTRMATLSHLGLSLERMRLFEEQKRTIVENLKKMKEQGDVVGGGADAV